LRPHAKRARGLDQRAFRNLGGFGGGFDLRCRPRAIGELLPQQLSRPFRPVIFRWLWIARV
jgi:hypothetical protein